MNACVNERPVFDRQTESAPERSDRSVRPRVEMPELCTNPPAPADSMTAFPWEDLMRVLVVEDESSISGFIRQGLAGEARFVVTVEADGQRGLRRALTAEFDVIILDIMLPQMNGLEVLRRARSQGVTTPVLLLTARDELDDKVAGLDAGADDYLTKPFAFSELLARTRALSRRPALQTDEILRLGELELDLRQRLVRLGDRTLNLSSREFALLEYLLRHAGQVLTRTQIGEGVWGLDFENDSNVVDVYVGYVRRKLTIGDGGPAIRTVRGVGYVWSAEPTEWQATRTPSRRPRSRRHGPPGCGGCCLAAGPCACVSRSGTSWRWLSAPG